MEVTVQIPEDVVRNLQSDGDLSSRLLNALLAEEYRAGRLTKPQLRQALGLETSYELDGFLKLHHVWIEYDQDEFSKEQADMERLGL